MLPHLILHNHFKCCQLSPRLNLIVSRMASPNILKRSSCAKSTPRIWRWVGGGGAVNVLEGGEGQYSKNTNIWKSAGCMTPLYLLRWRRPCSCAISSHLSIFISFDLYFSFSRGVSTWITMTDVWPYRSSGFSHISCFRTNFRSWIASMLNTSTRWG